MDSRDTWSASTKNGFARSVQRGLKWAEKQGLIDRTPIPSVEKPGRESREVVISPEEFDDLLARFPDQEFRDVLITCWESGCRPQEMMRVEARHVDLAHNRWVFRLKESKGKQFTRIVYLTDRAAEITRRLAGEHPTGKLFRNADGEPWDKNAINRRFHRKKKALGRKLCLYHIRHSFATRMLLAGVDAIIVSMWLGHKDVSTLAKTYQHLQQRPEFLHEKLRQANTAAAGVS
jgi:integrase